jgi:hypothetical protein
MGQRFIRRFSSQHNNTTTSATGGLLHRISSFFVGAGLTALVSQYYIFLELREGNKLMIEKHASLEKRLADVEKKL